ncbi:MAG: hypothetical protein KAI17_25815, partial [Thiotrichaceae bacterium]|nr:hypothetical protein [Thiotrichaceae bacterium]
MKAGFISVVLFYSCNVFAAENNTHFLYAIQLLLSSSEETVASEQSGPPAGNPYGYCAIPAAAAEVNTSQPDIVIGNGTAESCTSEAFVQAVALGGIITFDCGADPVEIVLQETAKVFNNSRAQIVIDGKNLVTLSGNGQHRILYQNTCDSNQVWTTSHCQDQDHPQL